MKREAGFTMVEMLIAVVVMLIIVATTLGTLTQAIYATEGVGLMADTQENLRAGMNYITRDLITAGEGLPQEGVTIPNSGTASDLNRPGPAGIGTFSTSLTALPPVIAGYQLGPKTSTSGVASDIVTMIYADTTLVDANGHWLNEYPIKGSPGTAHCSGGNTDPAGSITTSSGTTTVAFDTTCMVINNGNTGINPGDLIMLQNNNTIGSDANFTASDAATADSTGHVALLCVSSVSPGGPGVTGGTNSITFSSGDAFNLNNSGLATGTITQIQNGSGGYPTTTATRIWMITYYIDNSTPSRPMLMRQVNLNAAQPVGEVIENFQIFYDILNAGSTPPSVTTAVESPTNAQLTYIRDAYVVLFARSEFPYSQSGTYFRNNLSSVVSMRGMDFYNEFTN
jgi:prepilin-type N-terminal cleavage/methylation domain-containing protein